MSGVTSDVIPLGGHHCHSDEGTTMKPLCPLFLAVATCNWAFAQETDSDDLIERRVNAVLNVEYSHQMSSRYRNLFAAAGTEGLTELKRSPHDSIAIQAAWEEWAERLH